MKLVAFVSQNNKKELAKAKFIVGTAIQDIAEQLNVSRRTVERWANEGDPSWRDLRQSNGQTNVIQLQPKPKPQNPKPAFRQRDGEPIDDLFAVEAAIAHLHDSLPAAIDQSKGGIAGALVKLIELKRKLKPETVADLVERVIELDIGPEEFLTELNNAWQRKRA